MILGIHYSLNESFPSNQLLSFLINKDIERVFLQLDTPFVDEETLMKLTDVSSVLKNQGLQVHLRFPTLHNKAFSISHPKLVIQNHLKEKSKSWLCPNHPELMRLFFSSFQYIYSKLKYDGLEFSHAQFPTSEDFGCFCTYCLDRALNQRSIENLIDRTSEDIFKTGFNLNAIRTILKESNTSAMQDHAKFLQQKIFTEWMLFRPTSIT